MKKELYYIGISGEDSTYTERWLTKKQADFIETLVNELETNREGCWIERVPTNREIKKILKDYIEWKKRPEIPYIIKFNKFQMEDMLFNRFMYDILYKERKIGWEVQGYIRNEIGKLTDLYKRL